MTTAVEQRVLRVFLCDDTPELRRLVRRAFDAEADLDVVGEADDPVDGLPLIESLQPEVVLMDLSMPRMDGLEALGHVARIAPDAAVVVFSGLRGESLARKAIGLGADAFVEKSAPLTELIATVREAARRRMNGEGPVRPEPAAARNVPQLAPPLQSTLPDDGDAVRLPGDTVPTAGLFAVAVLLLGLASLLTSLTDLPPDTLLALFLAPVVLVANRAGRVGVLLTSVVVGAAYGASATASDEATPGLAAIGVGLTAAALGFATLWASVWVRTRASHRAELTAELRRVNTELEQFATVASHDLSAPLRTISGFATVLQTRHKDELPAESAQALDFITAGTARMSRTIEDLLAFARAGRVEPSPTPVALGACLNEAKLNLTTVIEERSAEVVHGWLPHVTGDPGRLAQLLQNLIANAIKFCPPERAPRIEIRAAEVPLGWRIEVRDNGIGIEPAHAARVFGMFQRLHTEAEFPGTGVGLAICQRIVERHGGRIWVDSPAGGGTVVCFTLPGPGTL